MTIAAPAFIAIAPGARAEFDVAVMLRADGRLAEARAVFEGLLAQHPGHLGLLGNIGVIAWEEGDLPTALDYLGRAVALDPQNPVRLRNLATILLHMKSYELAAEAFLCATALDPSNALAHHGLGVALRSLEQWDEAEKTLHAAIELDPALSDALVELALVHIGRGAFAAAEERLNDALRVDPVSSSAWRNLGSLLMKCNRPVDAAAAFGRAITLRPDEPDYHTDFGMALLQQGEFDAGWREYERRWDGSMLRPFRRPASLPLWNGAKTPHTILLHTEQGFGDGLQFCRYAPLVAERGHDIVLEVERELVELIGHSLGGGSVRVVERSRDYPGIAGLPPVEAHCPLMSLPAIFGTTLDTVPSRPYLEADAAKVLLWGKRLGAAAGGMRIGLVWAGNPRRGAAFAVREADARRSMTLAELAPLLDVPGASFVSLQKGEGRAELHDARFKSVYDADPELGSFADTAALVANLDLVICVDTSIAHLAGGMGKPVWMLSRFDGCWRWLLNRSDSPWYPSLRIFRQGADRSWAPVVAEIRDALTERLAKRQPG
jgi:tetratricopeptide (TPR) repeat protein